MANYPVSLPSIPDVGPNLSSPPGHSVLHDTTRDELLAVATELGTAPRGSFATVKDRLIDHETKLADLNSAWIGFSGGGNWSGSAGYYKRVGNIVFFRFQGTQSSAGGIEIYYTLPAGYRPAGTYYFTGGEVNTGSGKGFYVNSSGMVEANGAFGSGTNGYVWVFECWFPV